MSARWTVVGALLACGACVEVPELARDNPCDPAVAGDCRGADAAVRLDGGAPDQAPDGPRIDAAIDGGALADAAPEAPDADPDCPDAEPESCNGLDDDCDGEADELAPIACYSGPIETRNVGACRTGTIECVDARWTVCSGAVLPEPEVCDQADNDCDGIVDERIACE